MLMRFRRALQSKKQRDQAVLDSRHWKNHPRLKICLEALRGSCTLAPMELHEAAITVVNIALGENTWASAGQIPPNFLPREVFVLWNDPLLPVFRAERDTLTANLAVVTAVASDTYFVSQTLDRVIHFGDGKIRIYSVSP